MSMSSIRMTRCVILMLALSPIENPAVYTAFFTGRGKTAAEKLLCFCFWRTQQDRHPAEMTKRKLLKLCPFRWGWSNFFRLTCKKIIIKLYFKKQVAFYMQNMVYYKCY